jgi:hypothetical protein
VYVLLSYGDNPPLSQPLPFAALLSVMLGIMALFVTFAAYAKATALNEALAQQGKAILAPADARSAQIIVGAFLTIFAVFLLCPFVLRPMYGLPMVGAMSEAEIIQRQQDPNYVGCYSRQYTSGSVTCKNTGADKLLEFLMRSPRRF